VTTLRPSRRRARSDFSATSSAATRDPGADFDPRRKTPFYASLESFAEHHPFALFVTGVFIAWWFARRYYKKAGNELRQEAAALKAEAALLRPACEAMRHSGQRWRRSCSR
jgi:hypothetical protein